MNASRSTFARMLAAATLDALSSAFLRVTTLTGSPGAAEAVMTAGT